MEVGPPSFRRLPPVTRWTLLACGAAFVLQMVWPAFTPLFALQPSAVFRGAIWQVLTYAYLHGGLFHFLVNMFVLWTFGREVEWAWGPRRFLFFYLTCAAVAGIAILGLAFATRQPGITAVGFSGALFGILAAFAKIHPTATVYVYFLIPLGVTQMVWLFGILSFLGALGGGAASLGHLAGLLAGLGWLRGERLWRNLEERRSVQVVIRRQRKQQELAEEVDRILDKISREGERALTERERRTLETYSRRRSR